MECTSKAALEIMHLQLKWATQIIILNKSKRQRKPEIAAIEMLHPGTPWYKVGQAAAQPSLDAGFQPIRNLCRGHQLKPWELHAGVSVPSYACGPDNRGFKGVVEGRVC